MQKANSSKSPLSTQINNDGQVQQAFADLSEAVIDQVLDGLAKDIPIIATVVNLYKSTKSIQQQLAIGKLTSFIKGLSDLTDEEKLKLQNIFEGNVGKQRALAENILLALDRQDNIAKPILLVRFFRAFINEKIDLLTFSRLKQALDKFNLELETYLRIFYGEEIKSPTPLSAHSEEILHELSLAGLATVSLETSGTIGGSANYIRNSIGAAFVEIGFKNSVSYGVQPVNLWHGQ